MCREAVIMQLERMRVDMWMEAQILALDGVPAQTSLATLTSQSVVDQMLAAI